MEALVGRPEVIERGMIWWEPIADIMDMESIDHAYPQKLYDALPENEKRWHRTWPALLDSKRGDEHYEDVVESIKMHGFVRPVTVQWTDGGDEIQYGDGHHRLAAAIDLGMSHILVQMVGNAWDEAVSDDSGSWDRDCPIPEENNVRLTHTCFDCGEEYLTGSDARDCCADEERPNPFADLPVESAVDGTDLSVHASQRTHENWCTECQCALWDRARHDEAHREGRLSH